MLATRNQIQDLTNGHLDKLEPHVENLRALAERIAASELFYYSAAAVVEAEAIWSEFLEVTNKCGTITRSFLRTWVPKIKETADFLQTMEDVGTPHPMNGAVNPEMFEILARQRNLYAEEIELSERIIDRYADLRDVWRESYN